MNGVIVVDKPQDFTSFDVVAVLRGCLKTKKIGHSGTLDPMATGILPIFVGRAAKAVSILPDTDKSYRAGFRLGLTSDTLDIWGKCTEQTSVFVSENEVLKALSRFMGDIEQVPPMYSALKVGGKKLCDLARNGIEVERQPRKVNISRLELISFDGADGVIEVDCSSGTYIRSLIDDIGTALRTGAVMTSLERTRACGFTRGTPLNELKAMPYEKLTEMILPVDSAFMVYPEIHLDEIQEKLWFNGVRLDVNRIKDITENNAVYRVYAREFLGVAKAENGELIPIKKLCEIK